MGKVLIRNTREHDITLTLGSTVDPKNKNAPIPMPGQIVIPGADGFDSVSQKPVHGSFVVDEEFLEAAKKKHSVIGHYFRVGWLYVDENGTKAPPLFSKQEQDENDRREAEELERLRLAAANGKNT